MEIEFRTTILKKAETQEWWILCIVPTQTIVNVVQ